MKLFNNNKTVIALALTSLVSACQSTEEVEVAAAEPAKTVEKVVEEKIVHPPVDEILSQVRNCNDSIIIRSQLLSKQQLDKACALMIEQESYFHELFNTQGKPVKDDGNIALRANVYDSRADYQKYATQHFDMPTNNGGMYLEGFPSKEGNQAEFVAYEEQSKSSGEWYIRNLKHEYVHYLNGRFNAYGDYCKYLHDDHAGPEYCPKPSPILPHSVWWGEGVGEYVARKNVNDWANKQVTKEFGKYQLSDLFNTSANQNGGGVRIYAWGYYAVRYMMENQRDAVEEMLVLMREGDNLGYQALIHKWGTTLDANFSEWLKTTLANEASVEPAESGH